MKKILLIVMTMMLAFTFGFEPIGKSKAMSEAQLGFEKLADQVELMQEHTTELDEQQLKNLKKDIRKSIVNNEIDINSKLGDLDFKNIVGYQFDETQENNINVVIPFKNKGENKSIENLNIALNKDLEVIEYSELLVEETDNTLTSHVYIDGEKVGETTVTKSDSSEGDFSTQGYMDRVVDCLEGYGINPDTALLLAQTCLTICTFTLGAGCLICAGAVTAGGGTAMAWCLGSSV
ncbi:hypothetical protein ACTWQB_14495 [Piscibacillus sp. B03]|uniref:hypothetical protein n=1 Tax=Piscibacillus sp. B03 TaxID=3457430 RepID=UPI003FCE90D2